MIEIITTQVDMPPFTERRFQKGVYGKGNSKWRVIDTHDGSIRYRGGYEGCILACHSLNKKFYREKDSVAESTISG